MQQVSDFLKIDLKQHCAYHPASGGAVECENGTLKQKLVKCCEESGLQWTTALPPVLMYMRMRKRARTNLSLFEVLFPAPPEMGHGQPGKGFPSTTLSEDSWTVPDYAHNPHVAEWQNEQCGSMPATAHGSRLLLSQNHEKKQTTMPVSPTQPSPGSIFFMCQKYEDMY